MSIIQTRSIVFRFVCPTCHAPLEAAGPDEWRCTADSQRFECVDAIWRFLPPDRAAVFAPFLRDYTTIRDAEGYGYDDPARYQRLPKVDPADPLAWQWRMRAASFASLRRHVLVPLARRTMTREETRKGAKRSSCFALLRRPSRAATGLRVLDLGAGVGWLSNQLARLGHTPCAIDVNLDSRDGLGAARHCGGDWPRVQAEFDRLPLADRQADLAIYNASLHYSADYRATLAEALRVLRPGGWIVIMDSPIYRRDASGRQMVAERQVAFARDYGTRSDALLSVGYLTWATLRELGQNLGLRWRAIRPWYGWDWALRPWRARLAGRREPSSFALLVACRVGE
ncbi:MAG TPA: class I SAM-dependent methyltransferase [Roseiflexaceae bacterium]|nr:class I SAM-dependent methyltransferase [Roseiflexaceae bacterium]